jgi:membrane-associated phospholipid phosphatase
VYIKKYRLFFVLFFVLSYQLYAQNFNQKPSKTEWLKTTSVALAASAFDLSFSLVPTPTCAWCAPNKFDHNLSQALIWKDFGAARVTSDILAFSIAPFMAFSSSALVSKNFWLLLRNFLVLYDSVAVAGALTGLAKISFRRARPGVVYGYDTPNESGANRSFWSGHTSFTFALLSSASVLAFKNNAPWAPYFAGASALVGSLVAYSRIAGAKHWTSDVLLGMAVGVGVGIAMPFLMLDNEDSPVVLSATPRSLIVSYAW